MVLYGFKLSGAAFWSFIAEQLHELGYKPTKSYPDVWLQQAVKQNGFQYYEYVLCCVDDILFVSVNPMDTMNGIHNQFKLKYDMVDEIEDYLGAQLSEMGVNDGNGREFWSMSLTKYCLAAIINVEE